MSGWFNSIFRDDVSFGQRSLQFGTLSGWFLMISLNVLSNTKTFGGETNASISAKYPTLFTPAGWAFSIWGLIFLWSLLYCIFIFISPNHKDGHALSKISVFPILVFFFAGVWPIAFNYEVMWLSLVIMIAILASLIALSYFLEIGKDTGFLYPFKRDDSDGADVLTRKDVILEFWFVEAPFSVFLGWISVATIANCAIVGVYYGMKEGQAGWAITLILAAGLLALAKLVTEANVAFATVITWATAAIYSGQTDSGVTLTALVVSSCIAGFSAIVLLHRVYRFVSWFRAGGATYERVEEGENEHKD